MSEITVIHKIDPQDKEDIFYPMLIGSWAAYQGMMTFYGQFLMPLLKVLCEVYGVAEDVKETAEEVAKDYKKSVENPKYAEQKARGEQFFQGGKAVKGDPEAEAKFLEMWGRI